MEISLLREFIMLSQTLNYTKAAEILHLTQPTLSKHIVAMEKELGCSLLERDRRRVELTEAGNVFAAAALQMVDTYDNARDTIHEIQTHTPLKVTGVMSDSAIASIASIASTFLDAEGEPPIVYTPISETSYLESLLNGEFDIALASADLDVLDDMGLAYAPLIRSPFVALVSLDNPLSSLKRVTMDDLRNYRFVKFADTYALGGWANIERVCQSHGYTPRTRTVLGRTHMNYCTVPLGVEDVMILQASTPQLRYLSDFAKVAVLPVADDDATFRLYALYKKDNFERVRAALDAYGRARKIIIGHGKGGALVESD
ncbi:LysR family transcriptional regulator [uncultured Adlercreutzia sp.]|uniref:LysR family transcriptional regulator n=1 Tax=uncultured Adlercreutzia sp. TaxID=875803 RepID=UPI0026F3EFD9|nr:LysR family transcriptional regulator [uncultured Adlercreutzia sp.]